MKCQFCAAENPESDQFCGNCGARMPVAPAESAATPPVASGPVAPSKCQFCGADLPVGDQFCGRCGARQSDTPGGAPAPASGAGVGSPRQWESAGYGAYESAGTRHRYAGFWIRFGAYLLDSIFAILVALIPAIIGLVVAIALVEAGQEPPRTAFQSDQQDEDTATAAIIGFFIGAAPAWLAYWYIATSLGGGWGKRICGLRIIKIDTGERPGFGTGALRYGAVLGIGVLGNVPFVGWIGSLLNYLWMIWDKDKQTFHDKAAGTVVVHP